jgi:beta-glucosidase
MRAAFCVGLALLVARTVPAQQAAPDYRNPRLAIEQRVADLAARMTLEEKIGQMVPQLIRDVVDTTAKYNTQSARGTFLQLFSPTSQLKAHDAAVLRNAAQRYLVEKTRLGIPEIFMGEALHGFMSYGATSFPQALALASTWDPALVRRVFTGVRDIEVPITQLGAPPSSLRAGH